MGHSILATLHLKLPFLKEDWLSLIPQTCTRDEMRKRGKVRKAVHPQERQKNESIGGRKFGGQKDAAASLKECNRNLQDRMNICQRVSSLKGRQIRAVVDNKGMSVLCGIGKEGC